MLPASARHSKEKPAESKKITFKMMGNIAKQYAESKFRQRRFHHTEVERIKQDRESNQGHLKRKQDEVQKQKEEQRVKLERRLQSRSSSKKISPS